MTSPQSNDEIHPKCGQRIGFWLDRPGTKSSTWVEVPCTKHLGHCTDDGHAYLDRRTGVVLTKQWTPVGPVVVDARGCVVTGG